MSQTKENVKNLIFRLDFDPFGLNLSPKIFFGSFASTSSYKLLQAIIVSKLKENSWAKLKKNVET